MMLLRREFTKLIHQKRSYVGWGGLLAVPLLITLAFYLNRNNHHHDNGPGGVISLAFHNGVLMPLAAIAMLSAFLLPLLAAMVGAYQLAGEAETGTIKTWLMHSISRGGVLAFGLHAQALLSGQTVSVGHWLGLSVVAYLYVLVSVICVLSLALLFATLTNSSLTAAIGALVVFIVMNILGAFSYFDFLKPYLFTSHTDAWQSLLSQPISWHPIVTGLITFAAYIAGLMAVAWVLFRRKDILV
jgi:ABC-2 type transport system permease protein